MTFKERNKFDCEYEKKNAGQGTKIQINVKRVKTIE